MRILCYLDSQNPDSIRPLAVGIYGSVGGNFLRILDIFT